MDNSSFWALIATTPTWVELTGTVAGAGDFSAVSDDQIPLNSGSLIFVDSGIGLQPDGSLFSSRVFAFDAASVMIGEELSLSSGGEDLILQDLITQAASYVTKSSFDTTGSGPPTFPNYGAEQTTTLQPVFDTVLTDNPLATQFIGIAGAGLKDQINQIEFKTNSVMTNVRITLTDNATGIVVRYIPDRDSVQKGTGGLTLVMGDNLFDFIVSEGTPPAGTFYLGLAPFVVDNNQLIDVLIEADAVALLGNSGGVPYVQTQIQRGSNVNVLTAENIGTDGSILFAESDAITSDPDHLFWDSTNNRLGIGTNSPAHQVEIDGGVGNGTLAIRSGSGASSKILLEDENGVDKLDIAYVDSSGTTNITVVDVDLIIQSNACDIDIRVTGGELTLQNTTGAVNISADGADEDVNIDAAGGVQITGLGTDGVVINNTITVDTAGQTLDIQALASGSPALTISDAGGIPAITLQHLDLVDTNLLTTVGDFTIGSTGALSIEADGGDLSLLSDSDNIILDAEIVQLIGGAAGYNLEHSGDDLKLVSLNGDSILELYTQTGDGTEIARFTLFDVGTSASQVNSERLNIQSNSGEWLIQMVATGTGSQRDLKIGSTTGDPVNFVALADGSTSIGSEAGLDVTVNSGNDIILNTGTNDGVGIDIAAPASCLHVFEDSGNTGAAAGITMEQDGSGDAVLHFITTGIQDWSIGIDQSNSNTFTIRPNIALTGAGPLQILTTGEVGIGGTPTAGNVLDVITSGTDIVQLSSNKAVTLESGNFESSSTDLFFNRADVGFNQSEFYLSNSNNVTATNRRFSMNFTDAGIEGGLFVGYNGFVGIAQDTPDHPLTIGTTAAQDADVSLEDASGNTMFNMRYNSSSNVIQLHATTQGTSHGMNLLSQSGAMAVEAHNSGNTAMIHSQDAHVIVRSGGDPISQERTDSGGAITDADAVLTSLNTDATNGVSLDRFQGDRDPHTNVTGAGGDVYSRADGASSGSYESIEETTGTTWCKRSILPPEIVEINSLANLEDLASGGTITVGNGEVLHVIFNVPVTSDTNFNIEEGGTFTFECKPQVIYTYLDGGGTLFTTATTIVLINALIVAGTFTEILFDFEAEFGNTILMDTSQVIGFDLGGIRRASTGRAGPQLLAKDCFFQDWGTLDCNDADVTFEQPQFSRVFTGTGNAPIVNFNQTTQNNPVFKMSGVVGVLLSGESLVKIDAGLHGDPSCLIESSTIIFRSGATMFDTSGTPPTAFAAVAQNNIVTTVTSIVAGTNGTVARFTHAGTSPFEGSTITLTGFTDTDYNVTGIVTFSNATSFEIDHVAFDATDSGTSTMTGVTITSGSHGLGDEVGVTINTDGSADYDGHFHTYNITGNTFDIAATFVATATGTWCTEGLDQTDPLVLALENPTQPDSKYIATAFVNDNTTANGAIVNNTFTDMVFGTGGSALIEGTTIERWKLVDDVLGIFEYTGIEPFSGLITFDFTMSSSGGTVDFRHKWVHDVGAGFVDLPDDVESLTAVGSNARPVTKTFPLAAVTGDRIKPQITRNSGTSGITTTYASIYATQ